MNDKRKLTRREKSLLYLLVFIFIIIAYWFGVHIPVSTGIQNAKIEIDTYSTENTILETKYMKMLNMKEELDALEAENRLIEIGPYDNLSAVMAFLNKTIASANNFQIAFSEQSDSTDLEIVRREAKISFECNSYSQAKQIVKRLENCDYLSKISSLSISPVYAEKGASIVNNVVEVSLSITFYERIY